MEVELTKILDIPDERIRVGKYIIASQIGQNLSGLKWVGSYGSFWKPDVADPKDIDLVIDIDPRSLDQFNRQVVSALHRNFRLSVDLFPIYKIREQYGVSKAQKILKSSGTLYGTKPNF